MDSSSRNRARDSQRPSCRAHLVLRNENRDEARRLGIRELILKPNTVEELGVALDRVLGELRSKN